MFNSGVMLVTVHRTLVSMVATGRSPESADEGWAFPDPDTPRRPLFGTVITVAEPLLLFHASPCPAPPRTLLFHHGLSMEHGDFMVTVTPPTLN